MSTFETNTETPVKWYTFYSEKSQRDYFYEPRSKVVTWIRPDELHTFPEVPSAPPSTQQQQEEDKPSITAERRVSFHASVDEGGNNELQQARGVVGVEEPLSDDGRHGHIPRLLIMLLLLCLVLVMAGSYMEWLPRGPLGSAMFGNDQRTTKEGAPKKPTNRREVPRKKKERRAMDQVKPNTENIRAMASREKPGVSTRKKERVKPSNVESGAEKRKSHAAPAKESAAKEQGASSRHEDTPKPRKQEMAKLTENEVVMAGSESKKKKKSLQTPDSRRSAKKTAKEEPPPRKKGCLMPFAHVFFRECRKMLAQEPVYDMDAFLDSLI